MSQSPLTPAENKDATRVKCLLVDDLEQNLAALRALLEHEGVELFSARSGVEALELMLTHDFGLALVDVQMPAMDGFELAELMRGNERTRQTPIIFLTAGAWNRERIFKGYESGAVDFMFKPVEPTILRSKVRVFVELNMQKLRLAEATENLRRAKEEADAANVLKSEFLANMSHEIRTPMTAILGFSELLLSDKLSEQARLDFASRIRSNGDHLLHLIDDILDLSKFESGRVPTEKIDFSLAETLNESLRTIRPLAAKKGLGIHLVIDGTIPRVLCSDPHRLRQIILNLVGNAIKFTPKGHVTLRVSYTDETLSIDVQDTGIGLSPEQAARLFHPFQQADSSVTRRFGGTGLGLALSRRIAQALGGALSLKESKPNEGSTFTLKLKAPMKVSSGWLNANDFPKAADEKVSPAVAAISHSAKAIGGVLEGVRILLAEDSVDNEKLMRLYLEGAGALVLSAHDGREAIELAIELANKNDVDLVLMDVQMPGVDGLEATRCLRAKGYARPIVALTAHALPEEIEKSIAAGCDRHVTKPVAKKDLIEAVRAALTKKVDVLRDGSADSQGGASKPAEIPIQ